MIGNGSVIGTGNGRKRKWSYPVHVLRMPADRMVRCALMALVIDASHYPTGSLACSMTVIEQAAIATTCGNGVESFNVARQSGVSIVNLRFK